MTMLNRGFLTRDDHISVLDAHEYILHGWLRKGAGLVVRSGGKETDAAVEMLSEYENAVYGGIPVRVTVQIPDQPETLSFYARLNGREVLGYRISGKALLAKMCGIQLSVDQYQVEPGGACFRLMGWALAKEPVTIRVSDENGSPMECRLERYARYDAAEIFDEYPIMLNCGFLIEMKPVPQGPVRVTFEAGKRRLTRTFLPTAGAARRADAKRLLKKGTDTLLYQGVPAFVKKLFDKYFNPSSAPKDYDAFARSRMAGSEELDRQRREVFPYMPKVSVVIPLYNTPRNLLLAICESVLSQSYQNIELCLADGSTDDGPGEVIRERWQDDPRVKYLRLTENKGISENTNAAIGLADGEYIMLSDHDDTIEPDAVYEIVRAINRAEDVDVVYTDEDKLSEGGELFYDPHFKPDFDLDPLRSNNYICHIFAVRRSTMEEAGLFRAAFDGAQDYDFILRCCEKARRIEHVPKALYHWRASAASTAANPESKLYAYEHGRDAVQAHYDRLGLPATCEMTEYWGRYRTRFAVQGEPLVSVIIPNRNHAADLRRTMDSLLEKTAYRNYEVLIAENGSDDPETLALYEVYEKLPNVRILNWDKPFNFSAVNNYAAGEAKGEYLLFLNNDVEVIEGEWMEEMLGYCQRPDTGAVGAKLSYPDGTIQHVGIILGMGGAAGHMFYGWGDTAFTYSGRGNSTQDLCAVTAACMMTKKEVFEKAGGFDEGYTIAFNDVDYCLKVREMGLYVVMNVYAHLIHYESASRGSDKRRDDKERHARFLAEADRLRERWKEYYVNGDPYFNPNLDPTRPDFAWIGQFRAEDHEKE